MSQPMMDPLAVISFPARDRTTGPVSTGSIASGIVHAFSSIEELDEVLLANSFTARYLSSLTLNDKIFILRGLIEDGTVTAANLLPDATIDADTDPDDEVEPWGTVWINETTPEVFQSDGIGNWTSIWDGST